MNNSQLNLNLTRGGSMKNFDQTLTQAYDLFSQKDFSHALDKISEAEEEMISSYKSDEKDNYNKGIVSIENFRGFVYLGLNETEEAKNCFEKSLMLNPNSSQACAGLGEVLFLNHSDEEAKLMFEWAIDINPLNHFAVAGLTKINKQLGLQESHNSLDIDSTEEDDSVRFHNLVEEAYQLFEQKKFDAALEKIDAGEDIITVGVMSHSKLMKISSLENFKGFCYLANQDYENARECYEKALNLNPKSSQACAGLAEILFINHEDDSAKTMFEWALKNEPKNQLALSGLKKVNESLGLNKTDNKLERKFEEEISNEISQMIQDGFRLYSESENEESLLKLQRAEELLEENFDKEEVKEILSKLFNFIGYNLIVLEDLETSQSYFERSLEINVTSSAACAGLGEVFLLSNKPEEAQKMFEWSVKNDPENRIAVSGLQKTNKVLGYSESYNSLLV